MIIRPFPILSLIVIFLSISIAGITSCDDLYSPTEVIEDPDPDSTELITKVHKFLIPGTNQTTYFDNTTAITEPAEGEDFYGQNAHYPGNVPSYQDNGDSTVTDLVTGLMWQSTFDHNRDSIINVTDKLSYDEILAMMEEGVTYAGYDDWRLPGIKEMYSLIQFSGRDVSPEATSTEGLLPFIDTNYFAFAYGDLEAGERVIDMQCATSTEYVSKEVNRTVFGVNFADGRIKGYGVSNPRGDKLFNYLLVRDNEEYGLNSFIDNGDSTITDDASGLMWMKADNGSAMYWKYALSYAEEFEFAGYSDWRLPDVKELQSIVDYSRSPASTASAAIDTIFSCTEIVNEAGEKDFPWYWSSTTHANSSVGREGRPAAYVAFGRSLGNMSGINSISSSPNWIDIHGAGSQRSDPKMGDPIEFSEGRGPQGDAIRILNYVRLVRTITAE